MTLLIRLLVSVAILFSNISFSDELTLELPQLSSMLSYRDAVRLNQVLFDSKQQLRSYNAKEPYWLASQIVEPNKNEEIRSRKDQLIEKLYFLAANSPEKRIKVNALSSFLKSNHFNFRHFLSLDEDLIRISSKQNPILKGRYQLWLSPRVNQVQIVGSFANEKINFIENGTLDDYLKTTKLPNFSEQSHLYIIQPDGHLEEINNGYWSQDHIYLAPGSIIFSGIEDLPNGFAQLNRQIAELLRFKAPLTVETSY